METEQSAREERAHSGAQSPEGAAAVLLKRAQDIADQLRGEAEEEAEEATAEARRLRAEAQRHHEEA